MKPSSSSTSHSQRSRANFCFMHHWYFDLIRLILWLLFPGLPLLILVWALWRWLRTTPRIVEPAWRSYVAIGAISLAGKGKLRWPACALSSLMVLLWFMAGGFQD